MGDDSEENSDSPFSPATSMSSSFNTEKLKQQLKSPLFLKVLQDPDSTIQQSSTTSDNTGQLKFESLEHSKEKPQKMDTDDVHAMQYIHNIDTTKFLQSQIPTVVPSETSTPTTIVTSNTYESQRPLQIQHVFQQPVTMVHTLPTNPEKPLSPDLIKKPGRRVRTTFSAEQKHALELAFEKTPYPDAVQREQIATKSRIPEARVQVFYFMAYNH